MIAAVTAIVERSQKRNCSIIAKSSQMTGTKLSREWKKIAKEDLDQITTLRILVFIIVAIATVEGEWLPRERNDTYDLWDSQTIAKKTVSTWAKRLLFCFVLVAIIYKLSLTLLKTRKSDKK